MAIPTPSGVPVAMRSPGLSVSRRERYSICSTMLNTIPDVDAFAYVLGDPAFAVSFRRGWTHGLPALVMWIALLAAGFAVRHIGPDGDVEPGRLAASACVEAPGRVVYPAQAPRQGTLDL